MTSKKRGPVPKQKGIASGYISSIDTSTEEVDMSTSVGPVNISIGNTIRISVVVMTNLHSNIDQIRKEAKKAIDLYFKLKYGINKREEAERISEKTKSCGLPIQTTGVNKRGKENSARRDKGD